MLLLMAAGIAEAQLSGVDLGEMDLDSLMTLEVTSVSGRAEKVSHAASAIFVITADDIRRAGVSSIPEALRLAPGIQVARIRNNAWVVSARGFGERYANKLQVLIDGRSLYTTVFGGVDWNTHNLLLEDIERIEVIRGPGAPLWGGNAVNGVINIITRHSRDTQGGLLTTSVGSHERVRGGFRYGSKLGSDLTYRLSGQYGRQQDSQQTNGETAKDQGDLFQGGFRVDWNATPRDEMIFTGSAERQASDDLAFRTFTAPSADQGTPGTQEWKTSAVQFNWRRLFARGDDLSLQASHDWLSREDLIAKGNRHVYSLDLQHHTLAGNRNELLWGAGWRYFLHDFRDTPEISLVGSGDGHSRLDLFAQDELTIAPGRFFLIYGAKLSHQTDTDFQFQPSFRALWTPSERHSVWGSVARALRTPTEVDKYLHLVLAPLGEINSLPAFATANGNPEFRSEKLLAYELGYRGQVHSRLSLDLAGFYNRYRDLRTAEPEAPFVSREGTLHLEVPLRFVNKMDGETLGAELSALWQPASRWTLRGVYSWLQMQLRERPGSGNSGAAAIAEGSSPSHQFSMHSKVLLRPDLDLNASLYRVSELRYFPVPGYTRVDAHLTWRPGELTAIEIGGQNLLRPAHEEFPRHNDFSAAGQATRNWHAKLTWRF